MNSVVVPPLGLAGRWRMIRESLRRPYRVPASMVLLVSLVPLYLFIPVWFPPHVRHVPEVPLDRWIPVVPSSAILYGALYLFLILTPVLVVRQEERLRKTVHAYLFVWITAYVFFFALYPTEAPRPDRVVGDGFSAWSLRTLYGADPPYNCFPSLHVAHSFVSALACRDVHRRVGTILLACALLVALSTLLTKQHYVLDVIAGAPLAYAGYRLFLRGRVRTPVAENDRLLAPTLTVFSALIVGIGLVSSWIVYWTTQS